MKLTVEQLDNLILDTFIDLVDNGFSIEVLNQNGYSTYQIYDPNIKLFGKSADFIRGEWLDVKYDLFDSLRFKEEIDIYLNSMESMNNELFYLRDRIISIPGLESFNLIPPCRIEIAVNHIQQGFGGLGSKFLTGEQTNPVYHRNNAIRNN